MHNEGRPLEDVAGLAIFDFDATLRDPKKDIFGALVTGELKRTPELAFALFTYAKKVFGVLTRDEFAAKAPELYQKLLLQNGVSGMDAFYKRAAGKVDRIHAGSVELIQDLVKKNIGIAFLTGSDEDFVRIFLEMNEIDPNTNIEILGSRYGKTVDGKDYTGEILQSNVDSAGKQRVVGELMTKYPGIPIVISGGDDEADKPALTKVIPEGLRLVVGKDKHFHRQLEKAGYHLYDSLKDYLRAPKTNRVLIVNKHAKPGKLTLVDVQSSYDELLPMAA